MSSWIIARNVAPRKKLATPKYYHVSDISNMSEVYMSYIAAYIYFQKLGEPCSLLDESQILKNTLRHHPQIRYLKDPVDASNSVPLESIATVASTMKFKAVQKIAVDIMTYDSSFNQDVINVIQRAGIKGVFDIGIHLVRDVTGPNLAAFKMYAELIKAYQAKAKKDTLSIYVMTDNYSVVTQFQSYCDASWKIASLSKTPAVGLEDQFIQMMGDVQIMTAVPALILDFTRSDDRFIYLMQRYKGGLTYFKEVKDKEWNLI